MSAFTHTPGPWIALLDEGVARIKPRDFQQFCIAVVLGNLEWRHRGGNAHLIAAAPDLLEVLKEILADGIHCDVVPHLHRKALDVIAKATGGVS